MALNVLEETFTREFVGEPARHTAMKGMGDHRELFDQKVAALTTRFHQVLADEIMLALADGICLHMAAAALEDVGKTTRNLTLALLVMTVGLSGGLRGEK